MKVVYLRLFNLLQEETWLKKICSGTPALRGALRGTLPVVGIKIPFLATPFPEITQIRHAIYEQSSS